MLDLVGIPEDWFSHNKADTIAYLSILSSRGFFSCLTSVSCDTVASPEELSPFGGAGEPVAAA